MWIFYALGSAFFSGLTSVLAKIGIKEVDSHLATALRTVVVVAFSWAMVLLLGAECSFAAIEPTCLLFLALSGVATGASWLCYFKALKLGSVSKVVPVDKSSTVLTMLLAFLFFGESITWLTVVCILLIVTGTYLMVERPPTKQSTEPATDKKWLIYAVLSAVFASLTAILGKVGIRGVNSTFGTAFRTIVVLIMAWGIVAGRKTYKEIPKISKRSWLFIGLSGVATGASWMCYYRALQDGPASVVVPIDKLSIVIAIGFAWVVLKETVSRKSALGLGLIVTGTMLLLVG